MSVEDDVNGLKRLVSDLRARVAELEARADAPEGIGGAITKWLARPTRCSCQRGQYCGADKCGGQVT